MTYRMPMARAFFLILVCFLMSIVAFSPPVNAHNGTVLSALTSAPPTIDGILAPGEWASADSTSFAAGIYSGTILVMNDRTSLYVAVSVSDTSPGNDLMDIRFDNVHNGVWPDATPGEDAIFFQGIPITFEDIVVRPDGEGFRDVDLGGTRDGAGATGASATGNVYEFRHPLCSGDPNDFCLSPGESVGFAIEYCPDYGCPADRFWPAPTSPATAASRWADIRVYVSYTVSVLPTVLTVAQGSSGSANVTIRASKIFGSPVSLGVVDTPPGVAATLSPTTVSPAVGGDATVALTVSVGTNVAPSRYKLNITATSGRESYSSLATLVVTDSHTSGAVGFLLLSGIAAAAVVGFGVAIYVSRRSKTRG